MYFKNIKQQIVIKLINMKILFVNTFSVQQTNNWAQKYLYNA
jgi:hypothetical protein